jgi:hypothetical protein
MLRPKQVRVSLLEIGDIKLSITESRAFVRDVPVNLTKKEFTILELLARNKGTPDENLGGEELCSDGEGVQSHRTFVGNGFSYLHLT